MSVYQESKSQTNKHMNKHKTKQETQTNKQTNNSHPHTNNILVYDEVSCVAQISKKNKNH